MEGQFYITTIAGLGVSLAGFSALLTLFRAGQVWDAVTLWRARAIVRTSLETALAMLTVIPIFYLAGSDAWGIRAGTLIMLLYGLSDSIKMAPGAILMPGPIPAGSSHTTSSAFSLPRCWWPTSWSPTSAFSWRRGCGTLVYP